VRRPNATSLTRGRGYQTHPINSNPSVAGQMLSGDSPEVQVVGAAERCRRNAAAADATLAGERAERASPAAKPARVLHPCHAVAAQKAAAAHAQLQADLGSMQGEQLGLEGEAQANTHGLHAYEQVHGRA
jgi:hypothetical protein